MDIIDFSPAAGRIFSKTAEFEQLTTGYHFTEGPVWDIKQDKLYFTDFEHHRIYTWSRAEGARVWREKANRPVGLSMAADGRIVSAETSAHQVAYASEKESTVIAGFYQGKYFNSPNDVVVKKDGGVFFTDPYSTAMGAPKALGFNGIFSVDPRGEVRLINDEMDRPNGIAFSPDESILYVNDSNHQNITAFSVGSGYRVSKVGVFATVDSAYGKGVVDGMKVDTEGNVWVTGPAGLWVLDPSGKPIAIIKTPEFVGNFCFGGSDASTLYLAASSSIYALPIGLPGIVPYRS
jgi:gluconolactonase